MLGFVNIVNVTFPCSLVSVIVWSSLRLKRGMAWLTRFFSTYLSEDSAGGQSALRGHVLSDFTTIIHVSVIIRPI